MNISTGRNSLIHISNMMSLIMLQPMNHSPEAWDNAIQRCSSSKLSSTVRPDVVLELAWTNNMIGFAFLYLLQGQNEKEIIAQQNMYAQLLPPALSAQPMPGMGGGFASPPPPVGGYGMPLLPPFGMPPMGPLLISAFKTRFFSFQGFHP
ncbi:hypothetical protein L6164_031417 [Bauhinia variegata]|uniref:Uncharacterized protein n=1 Tax=Bauhinia variegata TaxID=167791 RepID=A0ACB9LFS6_BAUVA|nr:hypothetical protein L6164_031417 [Bauhinia variegata]